MPSPQNQPNSTNQTSSTGQANQPPPAVVHAQLTRQDIEPTWAGYGQFSYTIKWVLTARLQVDAVILQKINVSCYIEAGNGQPINISTYTAGDCMWQSHPLYWELWFVRAGELRPTYLGNNTRVPSFDQAATIDNDHDDNYGTGIILNKRDYPSGNKKGITKGWVRYLGTAGLYRVPDLQSVNANWLNQFQVYNSNQPTPAGTLPYIDTNPNFSPTAMEGREVIHNMVAYWNSCWPTYPGNKYTKVEPNPAQAYSDADLWAKVLARGPQQQATPALSGAKRKVPAAFLAPVHGYGTRSNSAANNKKQKTGHGAQVVSPASACSSAAQKNP